MNSLFRKLLNQLLIFVFTFTFVNIDVAMTKSEMRMSFIPIQSAQAGLEEKAYSLGSKDYEKYKSGITRDEDGIASKTERLDLAGASKAGDMWALVGMLALGLAAMSLLKMCKKFPIDVMIAAAGGLAFIVGEVMYINAFEKMKKKTLEITLREDGKINNKQVQMLEEEKQVFHEIVKAAKTKIMIQQAAAAAFFAAAAYATFTYIRQSGESKACTTQLMSLASTYMSTPGMGAAAASCQAANTSVRTLDGSEKVPGRSLFQSQKIIGLTTAINAAASACPGAMGTCGTLTTDKLKSLAICLPLTVASVDPINNQFDSIEFFANHLNLEHESLVLMSKNKFEISTETPEQDEFENMLESPVEKLLQPYQFASFIDEVNPLYKISGESIKKANESEVQFYIRTREEGRYFSGEVTSMSLSEYEELNMAFPKNSKYEAEYSQILTLAASKGMDLLFPQANAINMKILGLVGAAAMVVQGIFATNMITIDLWVATPGKRAIGWGGLGALTMRAVMSTKNIKNQAEENIEKIDIVLEKMRRLQNINATTLAVSNQSIPAPTLIPLEGNPDMAFGDLPTPCLVDGSSVGTCGSISSGLSKDKTFATLPSGLTQTTNLAGRMADGMVGRTSLSGATVDATAQLAAQQGAMATLLKKANTKLNKMRKANGQEAVDHDKLTNRFMASVKKSVNEGLKGTSGKDLMASMGGAYSGSGKDDGDGSDKDKKASSSENKFTVANAISLKGKKKSGLSFNFKDEDELDDLSGLGDGLDSDSDGSGSSKMHSNEESGDDIHENSAVSIFTIISVRYLKTGFKRLLNEK